METITTYLDNMFARLPRTKEVLRAKEELLATMEEKYNAYKREGKTENEAIGIVISDNPNAQGLEIARQAGIPAVALDPALKRKERNERIAELLRECGVELVCLAGYMRILGPEVVNLFPGRVLNVHPALLPAFPGLEAQRQALEYGVRFAGCTVHFVDNELDHGPIVLQAVVPVEEGDTEETLSARILEQEHRVYPEAVRLFLQGLLCLEGRRVRILPPPRG